MLYFAADRLLANVIDTTSSHDTRQATISLWVLVFSLALMVCYLDTRMGTALILAYIALNAYRCSGSFSNAYSTYLVERSLVFDLRFVLFCSGIPLGYSLPKSGTPRRFRGDCTASFVAYYLRPAAASQGQYCWSLAAERAR